MCILRLPKGSTPRSTIHPLTSKIINGPSQRLVPPPCCRPMSVWLPSMGRCLVHCRKQLQAHAQATENPIVKGVYSTLRRGIEIDKMGSEQGVTVPSQQIMELLANVTFYEDIPNGFTPNFDTLWTWSSYIPCKWRMAV